MQKTISLDDKIDQLSSAVSDDFPVLIKDGDKMYTLFEYAIQVGAPVFVSPLFRNLKIEKRCLTERQFGLSGLASTPTFGDIVKHASAKAEEYGLTAISMDLLLASSFGCKSLNEFWTSYKEGRMNDNDRSRHAHSRQRWREIAVLFAKESGLAIIAKQHVIAPTSDIVITVTPTILEAVRSDPSAKHFYATRREGAIDAEKRNIAQGGSIVFAVLNDDKVNRVELDLDAECAVVYDSNDCSSNDYEALTFSREDYV